MTLEERVAALEQRVEQKAGLRASGDRDLADMAAALRSQRALIQAVAITQSEHTQLLDRLSERLGRLEERLEAGLNQIITMLHGLTADGDEPPR